LHWPCDGDHAGCCCPFFENWDFLSVGKTWTRNIKSVVSRSSNTHTSPSERSSARENSLHPRVKPLWVSLSRSHTIGHWFPDASTRRIGTVFAGIKCFPKVTGNLCQQSQYRRRPGFRDNPYSPWISRRPRMI
jgi:hypothetical protein